MKRNLFYTFVFSICFGVSAQSPTENYIKSTIYTAPSTGVITENDTLVSVTYFDGLGRPKQTVSVSGGASRLDHNLLPWKSDWILGSGSTAFFNKNGQNFENERIMDTNPFGKTTMLWQCGNDPDNNGDGGWNTDYFPIDNTTAYRYSVWVKRTGSQDGKTYHGTQNVNNLDESPNDNPYFWANDLPELDQWYLLVGVVHPHDYTDGDTGISGVYDINGNKVLDGSEFKWDVSTTISRFRNYLFYSTDTSVRQYFYNPVLQKIDGTEASIADLVFERKTPDVVTPIVYDSFGRQTREYLPYTAPTQNGQLHLDPLAEVEAYYNIPKYGNTTNPYSEKILENSPLNRVMKQGAPGNPWAADPASDTDHSIKFSYDANAADEVRLYKVSTTVDSYAPILSTYIPTLENPGFYLPGRLYKTIIKDENWQPGNDKLHTTEEFKDFQGRVVLKRTYADLPGEPQAGHDTYYVYDRFSNLSYVIPPKVDTSDGVSQEELDELCYQYVYDHRNRMVEKKLPGKGWEYIVYNKLDLPVFTQDQYLANQGKWMFTKYDKFSRALYTGLYASTDSREALQTILENHTPIYESKTDTPTIIDGTDVYYSNAAFPDTGQELLTIHYYDTYNFDLDGAMAEDSYGVAPSDMTKTLNTGSKIRILGTDGWITTVSWYNKKARPIYSYTKNPYLNTIDKIKYKVNFIGKVLETTTVHTKDAQADITAIEKFRYDRMGRLLKHTHQVVGHPEEVLAENVYDELGQLIQKKTGNNSAAPLQTVDYSYNIRGWLQQINDVNNLGNDLFSFQINYNDPTAGIPLYNGNISQTHWRTNNTDNSLKNYTYSYDPLSRITAAIDLSGNYSLNGVSYDKNGNILSLNRQGPVNEDATGFDTMDDLTYSYDSGNKLVKVADAADDTYGFKDDAVATADNSDDYSYDINGNMISDTNKGITSITYNHLNLPTEIVFNNDPSQKISYIYSTDGTKQQKVVTDNAVVTTTDYAGAYIYENSSLKFFNQAEGYIEPDGAGSYDYVYQYKDHLGNVRISYSDTNKDGVVDVSEIIEESNYYPFGLKHRGYNSQTNGTHHNWDFLNQERQEELGLNWLTFRYRNYIPEIGRFFGVDPITEEYHYITPYQFASNNPVWKIEIEGLEGQELSGLDLIRQGFANIWNAAFGGVRVDGNGVSKRSTKERVTQFAKGGNMVSEGATTKEAAHALLDVAGTVDPTPITDTAHSIWYAAEGEYVNAGLTIAGALPYLGDAFKALKYTKYSDEVADLVKTTGKLDGAPKEVVTVLNEGTLENGIKVANDLIGGLGDDAVEKLGKFGSQKNVVTGYQSAKGNKGWRIDYDPKKGGHINWWNGKESGAIILNAGMEKIDQILKNKTF